MKKIDQLKITLIGGFLMAAADPASASDKSLYLNLADGSRVLIQCNKLSPEGKLTYGFVRQFDPHPTLPDRDSSTDEKLIGAMLLHLESHGVTPAEITQVQKYCLSP